MILEVEAAVPDQDDITWGGLPRAHGEVDEVSDGEWVDDSVGEFIVDVLEPDEHRTEAALTAIVGQFPCRVLKSFSRDQHVISPVSRRVEGGWKIRFKDRGAGFFKRLDEEVPPAVRDKADPEGSGIAVDQRSLDADWMFTVGNIENTEIGTGKSVDGNEAFVWDEANGMRSLQTMLEDGGVDMTGWTLTSATGVSDDGKTIVGYGTHNGNTEGFVAVIPEPSTVALFGISGLAIAAYRRIRKSYGC